jgi:predicted enzyme related to lactoylglutathione lyase
MIKYRDLAFVCYPVNNMTRARKFYEGVLGLKQGDKFSKSFVEYNIGHGTLALGYAPDFMKPSREGTSAALEVADLDVAVEHLRKKKIKIEIGPVDNPLCRMVGIRDPDGNFIALHQRKRTKPKKSRPDRAVHRGGR